VLAVCAFGPRITSLRLQLAMLSCLTFKTMLAQLQHLYCMSSHETSSFYGAAGLVVVLIIQIQIICANPFSTPGAPLGPGHLPFSFTLQPGSPLPSLFESRPTVVYVFAGDIDWLHIDTSLLLALRAPAKHIIFLREMEMPAAADVVLFSCRFASVESL